MNQAFAGFSCGIALTCPLALLAAAGISGTFYFTARKDPLPAARE